MTNKWVSVVISFISLVIGIVCAFIHGTTTNEVIEAVSGIAFGLFVGISIGVIQIDKYMKNKKEK